MITYVAFLRGINVGGHNLIKMADLVRIFTKAGCREVRTYIQSGNVIFSSALTDIDDLTRKLEAALKRDVGYHVPMILKTLPELKSIVRRDPFKKFATETDAVCFVVFFRGQVQPQLRFPLTSTTDNLDVLAAKDGAAFVIARRKKNGQCGFPNGFVEKQFGLPATTRNWSTLNKIIKAAE